MEREEWLVLAGLVLMAVAVYLWLGVAAVLGFVGAALAAAGVALAFVRGRDRRRG